MSKPWDQYSLADLRARSIKTFRQGGGTRPDVLLIDMDGELAVLKDQNGADKWFARLIGPLLNWRECKALQKLQDVECTPILLAKPDSRSFLMSYHPSEQITRLDKITVEWPDFFDRLQPVSYTHLTLPTTSRV